MITGVRLPIPWGDLGFPVPLQAGPVTLWQGVRGWAWEHAGAPDLGLRQVAVAEPGRPTEGWGIDHVVLAVPGLDAAADAIAAVAGPSRRRIVVRGRATAFWLVGTLLEVVEEASVDRPLLCGVSLETSHSLDVVADRWRDAGFGVGGPRQAFQPGRRIITVEGLGAGLAVMSERSRKP